MVNRFPVPDEAGMERLVISVYENLPVADIARLNRIEERMSRKLMLKKPERKANTLPWWVILLLAGGFATAAWWAGEKLSENFTPRPVAGSYDSNVTEKTKQQDTDSTIHIENTGKETKAPATDRKSSVIYQRENF